MTNRREFLGNLALGGAVLGIHGAAYPVVFSDAVWAKFQLGKRGKIKDPRTKKWATRNVERGCAYVYAGG